MSRPNDKGYYRIDKQDVAERPFSFRPSDFLDPNQRSLKRISGFRIMTALCAGMVLMVAFISAITFSLPDLSIFPGHSRVVKLGVSQSTMEEGRSKCYAIRFRSEAKIKQKKSRKNPRAVKNQKPILIKNAVIWDGEGGIQENMDILMKDGIVQQIEEGIQLNPSLVDVTDIVDVRGHVVSPGLVDMHSHIGSELWPTLVNSVDNNEMSQPLVPFVRIIDVFSPTDAAIKIVASGGVTSALALPGSGNLMGGEAYVFKLRPTESYSNEDMLVQANINEEEEKKWRWMKMACGENPKRNYRRRQEMPYTRLGEAYLFRHEFTRARTLMREQDDWCKAATATSSHRFETPFPEDLSLESLVALLRGDVLLNVHCYETQDIEAMVRHSLEFNFTISAFHHALDAYLVPDILRRAKNNITIATFADHWGYKKEAFQSIPEAPRILYDAGVPVAIKSDHPVLNSQHLVFEAAKTTHYGLPPQEAFNAVTSIPAKAIGLGHRIGSLKVGYDADIVVWDREPLDMGASPLQVYIDGVALFDQPTIFPAKKSTSKSVTATENTGHDGAKNYIVKNISYLLLDGKEPITGPIDVVVRDGDIVCSSVDCKREIDLMRQDNVQFQIYDVPGGYILPGLVGVGSNLGLIEIESEDTTGDGKGNPSKSHDPNDIILAYDGIKLGTRHLQEAYRGGVATVVTAPMSSNVVLGVSVAFKTLSDSLLENNALVSPVTALHLQIGNDGKSDVFPTISSQIGYIRQILTENLKKDNYYGQAARGEIPTIFNSHNKDEIASIIELKRDFVPKGRFVVMGGSEAHLVAPFLAQHDIAVVLQPALCTPARFDSIHCLTGAPLTNGTAAHVLQSHRVKLGLGIFDSGLARNLLWDAGWLAATSPEALPEGGISETEAIQFVTSNIRDIFGLDASPPNEFIVVSGSPFDLKSRILFSHDPVHGVKQSASDRSFKNEKHK